MIYLQFCTLKIPHLHFLVHSLFSIDKMCLSCIYVSYKPLELLALFSHSVCLGCLNFRHVHVFLLRVCLCTRCRNVSWGSRDMVTPAFLVAGPVWGEPTHRGSSSRKASNAGRKRTLGYIRLFQYEVSVLQYTIQILRSRDRLLLITVYKNCEVPWSVTSTICDAIGNWWI